MQGFFISFEGGEGAGKSTQLRLLADVLKDQGHDVLTTQEPGGTVGAEQIRAILKSGDIDKFDPLSEALLFFAARRDHVVKRITPGLKEGRWVLTDRFSDSTFVYQCVAGSLPVGTFHTLCNLAVEGFQPHLTLVLDVDPRTGLARSGDTTDEGEDAGRFERKGLAFHTRVREGYRQIVRDNPDRCVLIDANGSIEEVHQRILAVLQEKKGLS